MNYLHNYHHELETAMAQSVQRLATGWKVRGRNPGGGRHFPPPPRPATGVHPAFYKTGTRVFPGGKSGRGVVLTTHPHLGPMLKKQYSYTSTPTVGLRRLL